MRIGITGASGHVGTNLLPLLLEAGHHLRVLVHEHPPTSNTNGPVETIRGDLLDPDRMSRFVQAMDAIIHLAARISIDSGRDPLVPRINIDGTRNLVNACVEHKVGRLVHFSSIHSYDAHPRDLPLDETRVPTPAHAPAYDRSKAAGDRIVRDAVRDHGLNAVILAPTAVFGPVDPGPSLLGQAIIDIHNGRVPMLPPGGYDLVDVRDVARCALAALDRGIAGEKFLISGTYRTVREIAVAIGEITGHRTVRPVVPAWLLHASVPWFRLQAWLRRSPALLTHEAIRALTEGHRDIRNGKAAHVLGHRATPFMDTLRDTLDRFRRDGRLLA
ncbi:MAG: NAD-dependent epimerase/dehydratase family protein [Flavobacteriales bacterium]|nr:NAD-dependent epimerase/dehydratase family protein [Flavobacteriales bacterium]MCB9166259.1 NAD-dependent epimerase/dehydratase family protein [Flavobacteriales bacterium]